MFKKSMVQTLDVNLVQTLVHLGMVKLLNSLNIKDLHGLWNRTENPCVGGSIPPGATSNPFRNVGVFCLCDE